jgi:hypothetical protein
MVLVLSDELWELLRTMVRREDKVAYALLSPIRTTTEQGNFLAFKADECMLTYRPANRIDPNENPWAARGRMVGRPARVARKFLRGTALEGLTDVDFERFTNNLESYRDYVGDITLVGGLDIPHWYREDRYADRQGSLNSSCMKYASCGSYMNIYTANPDVCQLAILTKDDGKLYGRALVWTLTDGRQMLDRVYGTDKTIRHMQKWATDNGIVPREDVVREDKVVQLARWQFRTYPYMDTLSYLDQKTGRLTANPTAGGAWATLHGTRGTDFWGATVRHRIPIIRQSGGASNLCQIAYTQVEGVSMRGAQRRLTNGLARSWQEVGTIEGGSVHNRNIVRGMDPLPERNRWRKMTDLEMRYFGMQPGATVD